jgi:hypothetical protein
MLPSIEKGRNLVNFRSFRKNPLLMLLGFSIFAKQVKFSIIKNIGLKNNL